MKYAILCRHHGWIDELLAAGFEPSADSTYPPRIAPDGTEGEIATFATAAEAAALAGRCNEHWASIGPDRAWARWRFDVVEKVMVPRWQIVGTMSEREKTNERGDLMVNSPESKSEPARPNPAIVRLIVDEIRSSAGAGTGAPIVGATAKGLPQFDLAKLPGLVTGLLEIVGMGADGKIDPEEARRIADILYAVIVKARTAVR